eukprot:TRINITY_DN15508_c0_g1_i1.p1 TRINITY_DN15508_c0_g1~~TRINITY_DN15508_c0_g1_i1.p1  ORF type:complete len:912 (+),score=204.60 TRINITY_DN15508_c0_g1_i1:88-2736(+)
MQGAAQLPARRHSAVVGGEPHPAVPLLPLNTMQRRAMPRTQTAYGQSRFQGAVTGGSPGSYSNFGSTFGSRMFSELPGGIEDDDATLVASARDALTTARRSVTQAPQAPEAAPPADAGPKSRALILQLRRELLRREQEVLDCSDFGKQLIERVHRLEEQLEDQRDAQSDLELQLSESQRGSGNDGSFAAALARAAQESAQLRASLAQAQAEKVHVEHERDALLIAGVPRRGSSSPGSPGSTGSPQRMAVEDAQREARELRVRLTNAQAERRQAEAERDALMADRQQLQDEAQQARMELAALQRSLAPAFKRRWSHATGSLHGGRDSPRHGLFGTPRDALLRDHGLPPPLPSERSIASDSAERRPLPHHQRTDSRSSAIQLAGKPSGSTPVVLSPATIPSAVSVMSRSTLPTPRVALAPPGTCAVAAAAADAQQREASGGSVWVHIHHGALALFAERQLGALDSGPSGRAAVVAPRRKTLRRLPQQGAAWVPRGGVSRGAAVTLLGSTDDGWTMVCTSGGTVGWIKSEHLGPAEAGGGDSPAQAAAAARPAAGAAASGAAPQQAATAAADAAQRVRAEEQEGRTAIDDEERWWRLRLPDGLRLLRVGRSRPAPPDSRAAPGPCDPHVAAVLGRAAAAARALAGTTRGRAEAASSGSTARSSASSDSALPPPSPRGLLAELEECAAVLGEWQNAGNSPVPSHPADTPADVEAAEQAGRWELALECDADFFALCSCHPPPPPPREAAELATVLMKRSDHLHVWRARLCVLRRSEQHIDFFEGATPSKRLRLRGSVSIPDVTELRALVPGSAAARDSRVPCPSPQEAERLVASGLVPAGEWTRCGFTLRISVRPWQYHIACPSAAEAETWLAAIGALLAADQLAGR